MKLVPLENIRISTTYDAQKPRRTLPNTYRGKIVKLAPLSWVLIHSNLSSIYEFGVHVTMTRPMGFI